MSVKPLPIFLNQRKKKWNGLDIDYIKLQNLKE